MAAVRTHPTGGLAPSPPRAEIERHQLGPVQPPSAGGAKADSPGLAAHDPPPTFQVSCCG